MSRFPRLRRRPDHWSTAHDRARQRAAERLDGPLGLAESTRLDEHLASCADCTAVAAAYDADRLALRVLRDAPLEPPRDLWARTAAAIEAESAARGRSTAPAAPRRGSLVPLGALSGIAVIVVVVGVSAVSSGLLGGSGASVGMTPAETAAVDTAGAGGSAPESSVPAQGGTAEATPLAVGAGDVEWLRREADGAFAYNSAAVRHVCPIDGDADCAALDDISGERIAMIAGATSIIGSPADGRAVVVSDTAEGGEQILVLDLPAGDDGGVDTSATAEPTASASATQPATTETPVAPSDDPTPTEPVASDPPSAAPTDPPSAAPTEVAPSPSVTPEPTIAASLAIASDITVVGESAAFSSDGAWFAFTARPRDGSAGPDVYVWRVGDDVAQQLTTGGRTYFGSWEGDTVLASRVPDGDGRTSASTVAIDPATGDEREAGAIWRPVLDPAGSRAVAWAGTVAPDGDAGTYVPTTGTLGLVAWPPADDPGDGSGVIATDVGADYDVRWDETGTWFAVWIADPSGSDVGRLSLYRVDPESGALERPDGAPIDVAALPGFSIAHGRLAWATPPGQGGEGSRVQVVAWVEDGVGSVETAPGEDVIVVR